MSFPRISRFEKLSSNPVPVSAPDRQAARAGHLPRHKKLKLNCMDKIIIFTKIVFAIVGIFLFSHLERPLINYAKDNAVWIERANKAYERDLPDYQNIKARLAILPKEKIEKAGAKIVPLSELSKENPSGKGIRIVG